MRTLSDRFEINLNTMQRACSELKKQGAIITQRGIGSFVTDDKDIIAALQDEMSGPASSLQAVLCTGNISSAAPSTRDISSDISSAAPNPAKLQKPMTQPSGTPDAGNPLTRGQ